MVVENVLIIMMTLNHILFYFLFLNKVVINACETRHDCGVGTYFCVCVRARARVFIYACVYACMIPCKI